METVGLSKLRKDLDFILNDYEFLAEEYKEKQNLINVYVQMRDLLEEMKNNDDLKEYDVEDIFRGIVKISGMGY